MDFILQYIDVLWLPIALLSVHKPQRAMAAGFFICCMLMMRLQVELMYSTGYPTGFTPLLNSSAHMRGLVVYSIFYVLYIAMAIYSPKSEHAVFLAASISLFFAALFTSMIVMVI